MDFALDESDAFSEISSASSLLRRRSKFGAAANNNSLFAAHIAENDDERERATIRRQSRLSSPTFSVGSSRRSLNISHSIAQMLPAQVQRGIEQCVKLNVENKINTKNAFSLGIIDFMMYIVRKKDMESKTLQVATSALDVSAKVYSLRVDSLHHMVLGLSKRRVDEEDEIDGVNNNINEDINHDGRNNGEKMLSTRKRRKKTHRLRTTIDTLQGEAESVILDSIMTNMDTQTTDMLLQVTIPQHCGQELILYLYRDIILDYSDEPTAHEENVERIKWPMVYFDHQAEIDPSLIDFQFLDGSPELGMDNVSSISCIESHIPSMIDDHFLFDLDASLPEFEEPIASMSVGEVMVTEETEFRDKNAPAVRQVEHIVDVHHNGVVDLMAYGGPSNLEYSFFGESVRIVYAGPTHWNVKMDRKMRDRGVEVGAAGLAPRRRRKELILEFDEETMDIARIAIAQKGRGKVQHSSWCESKLVLPQNTQFDLVNMKKFLLRPDDTLEFSTPQSINATAVSELIDEYDYSNTNDQEYCGANDVDRIGDDSIGVDENMQLNASDKTFGTQSDYTFIGNTSTQRTESSIIADNLVEMPKLIAKLQISYTRCPKKIDIHKLKAAIWIKLVSMNSRRGQGNESHEGRHTVEELDANSNTRAYTGPEIKFSCVYSELPTVLSKKDAADLSFHIAMFALLQLANEKNLNISSIKNLNDCLIYLP